MESSYPRKPRIWQTEFLDAETQHREQGGETEYRLEVCPGAGKSFFAGMVIDAWFGDRLCDHVIVVVPSTEIRENMVKTLSSFGLDVRDSFFYGTSRHRQYLLPPPVADVTVCTIQELNTDAKDIIEAWQREHGWTFAFINDEVHHSSEDNSWGRMTSFLSEHCERALLMTGTAFRSDNERIAVWGDRRPHKQYLYKRAIVDKACRKVSFQFIRGNVDFGDRKKQRAYSKPLGHGLTLEEQQSAKGQIYDARGEVMSRMIVQVDEDMQRVRRKYPKAACLFVCRPGRASKDADRHVDQMARAIRELTGYRPETITHKDPNARGKIDRFRNSDNPYLVAINMISEGVDIPRLRRVAWCRYTDSELFFRQVVGRALRVLPDDDLDDDALVFLPEIGEMIDFVARMREEAVAGSKELEKERRRRKAQRIDDDGPRDPNLVCIDVQAENGDGWHESRVFEPFVRQGARMCHERIYYQGQSAQQIGATIQEGLQQMCTPEQFDQIMRQQADQHQQDNREVEISRLKRVINRYGHFCHESNYGKAYAVVFEHAGVEDLDEIRATWPVDLIRDLVRDVKQRIEERVTR